MRGTKSAPVFAQLSFRENERTRRSPQQVMDDAKRAVEAAGWDLLWGADADHLKTLEDLAPFLEAGYTFFTIDPGGYGDNMADTDSADVLSEKIREAEWDELSALYLHGISEWVWGQFEQETLRRAIVKYGRIIFDTDGEMVDYELILPLVHLRSILQD